VHSSLAHHTDSVPPTRANIHPQPPPKPTSFIPRLRGKTTEISFTRTQRQTLEHSNLLLLRYLNHSSGSLLANTSAPNQHPIITVSQSHRAEPELFTHCALPSNNPRDPSRSHQQRPKYPPPFHHSHHNIICDARQI